jgi:ectoine hydroxylase-related dioxygenase (phytanoyl-CoA dioxygenase family)
MDMTTHLEELEAVGYTIFPRLIAPETTASIRSFIDTEIAEGRHSGKTRGGSAYHYRICSPIDHPITAELASDRRVLEIAKQALRASNLRLRQQMFMRTDPCGEPAPSRPDGWHVDTPFTTTEWNATPCLAFLQVFYYCNPVRSGGAATMVLPASHKKTFPVADALVGTEEGYSDFWQNPVGLSGADTSTAMEVLVEEGDVLFFNPMLLHSGSRNVTDTPRYAFHCSFYDHSSDKVRNLPQPVFYDIFSEAMKAQMPPDLLSLLER